MTGRPSIFLQELRTMAKKVGIGDELVRHKFENSLPPTISPVIAAQKETSLTQLGVLADSLIHLLPTSSAYQINSKSSNSNMVNAVTDNSNSKPRSNSPIPYGLRPYKPEQKQRICKAHIFYADSARTCKPWCKWPIS